MVYYALVVLYSTIIRRARVRYDSQQAPVE